MPTEWTRGEFTISTDPQRLDVDVIHGFLMRSYWAAGRSRERVVQSIRHSLPFGLYRGTAQIGFGRVVTDYVVIAFLADVFVIEAERGRGLGKWLVETITSHEELRSVRRWLLGTRDAHELYRGIGFAEPKAGVLMERVNLESDAQNPTLPIVAVDGAVGDAAGLTI
jgi:GNAT superfamily N-acetyltransferase